MMLLRNSGSLVRSSRQLSCAAHLSKTLASRPASLPRPLYAYARSRQYATQPNGPKDEKNDANVGRKGDSQPPKGMEHLYDHKSPMSPGPNPPKKEPEDVEQRKLRSNKLSKEEEEILDGIFSTVKKGMPKSMSADLDKIMKQLKEQGVPKELNDVVKEARDHGLTPARAAKLWRITQTVARRTAENIIDEKYEQPKQKTTDDPGPDGKRSEGKEDGKKSTQPPFTNFQEIKIDMPNILMGLLGTYLFYRFLMPSENSREITWQEFRNTFFDKGLVEKLVVLNGNKVKVYLHREAVVAMYPESPAASQGFYYYFSIGSVEAFERRVESAQSELGIPSSERIPVSYHNEGSWINTLLALAPTLMFIGAILYASRRAASGAGGQNGIFGMGRSRAKKFNHETDIKVKFADVAGMDEAKTEIMEFVSFLKEPSIYRKLGAKIPRGAILSGPPGTGKTLLAKATAGESGVPFFSVSGSEFVEMFVGVGASRVRDLFANARKHTPCIIFIDEIDAIGKARSKGNFSGGGNEERETTLNQILTEMDGFNTSEQVVVLAGTNRPDVLDKALMRPGRFDRHIAIDPPTMDGRKQIFAVHLRNIVTTVDQDYLRGRLAALTPGFSGADIANCVNEAALIAARNNAEAVEMTHFEQAVERVIGGLEKKSMVLSPEEKKTVAYHEAGHAICGWYFQYADPLLKVSIIPRSSGALGYAQYLPNSDAYLMTVRQLMDRMAMTLGGRVSEELHFDTVTSGASDDFNKVTRMATAMVTKWGMSSKIGYLHYQDDGPKEQFHKPFSEETSRTIDAEVKRIVDEAYKQCRDLLTEKKKEIGIVAEDLLTKEVLSRDDMVRLLGKRPWEEKAEFSKYFDGSSQRGDKEGPVPGTVPDPPKPTPGLDGGATPAPTTFERFEERR